jgi:hypothetical protein
LFVMKNKVLRFVSLISFLKGIIWRFHS